MWKVLSLCKLPHNQWILLEGAKEGDSQACGFECLHLIHDEADSGEENQSTFQSRCRETGKHRLFPLPVGCTMRECLPPSVALMMCSCQSLNVLFLKYFTSNPVSCISSFPMKQWVIPSHKYSSFIISTTNI